MARSMAPAFSVFMVARCSRIPARMASLSESACLQPQLNAATVIKTTIRNRERAIAFAMCPCCASVAADCRKFLTLVGLGRFELPTYGLGNRRSIHLSYSPVPQHCNTVLEFRVAPDYEGVRLDLTSVQVLALERGPAEGPALLCRCADS